MPLPADKGIAPILAELSACLCNILAKAGDEFAFCGVIVGDDLPLEYLGAEGCGVAYVRLVSAFPSSQEFPSPDSTATCATIMAYSVAVGIARCTPLGANDGSPPEPEEWAAVGQQALADMAAIRRAIKCCLTEEKFDGINYVLGMFTPASEGVAGGEFALTIQELI